MLSNHSSSEENGTHSLDSKKGDAAMDLEELISQPFFKCPNDTTTPKQIVLLNRIHGSNTKWISNVNYWIAKASSTTDSPTANNSKKICNKEIDNTDWKMINQYRVGRLIGKGLYSTVRKIENILNDDRCSAMKVFLLHMCMRTRAARFHKQDVEIISELDKILDEILLLDSLHHRNICQLEEVYLDSIKGYLYMIMEYVPFRCLSWDQNRQTYCVPQDTIEKNASGIYKENISKGYVPLYSERGARHVLTQLICAVEYIHNLGIIHKDIKPENFLLDRQVSLDFVIFVKLEELQSDTNYYHAIDHVNEGENITHFDMEENQDDFTDSWLWEDSPHFTLAESFVLAQSLKSDGSTKNETTVADAIRRYYKNSDDLSNIHSDYSSRECATKDNLLTAKLSYDKEHCESQQIISMTTNLTVKLIDFNSAVVADPPNYFIWDSEGTRHFTPPECLSLSSDELGIKGKPRDMWSIGCTLHCLLFGRPPFSGGTPVALLCAILSKEYVLPQYRSISEDLKHLLRFLLDKNFERRITLAELKMHPWLSNA